MLLFFVKRLVSAVVLTVAVTALSFVLLFRNGTNIARMILGPEATAAGVRQKVSELGLDKPVLGQYFHWLITFVSGRGLGASYYTSEPVTQMLGNRIPVTLSIIVGGFLLIAILSVLIGVLAAVRGGWIDRLLQFMAVLGYAVPSFLIALILIIIFALDLHLFPATGYVALTTSASGWALSLVLPVAAVVIGGVGGSAQQFRGTVSDVLKQDFVRTLRSRGIPGWQVVGRHVLRNAAGPGLITLGLHAIGMLGAVVVIEQVFSLPGVGNLIVTSALDGDVPVVMGCVLFTVIVVMVVNLITDLANAWLNPKERTS
jgi:peptide/nickel transport system permease protein